MPQAASQDIPDSALAASPGTYDVFKVVDYRRFLAGNVLSTIGIEMQAVALGWELRERAGPDERLAATWLAYVGLVQVIPVLLLALPAGHAADRYSRKHLILLAQVLMGTAAVGLAWMSAIRGPIPAIYAFLLLGGIGHAVSMPARWSILPQLVPRELIGRAITWNSSGWQVSAVGGPAVGGLVLWLAGRAAWVYALDAAICASVFCLMLPLRLKVVERDRQPVSFRSLLAGLSFVRSNDLILATITLDLFAVFLGGAVALLPIFARDILRIGPAGFGWLRAAPALGALSMALFLAHRPPMRRAGPALLWAVAGFGAATIGFGLSTDVRVSVLMLFLTGGVDNISVVVRSTLIQVLTPDAMRGRVSAVNSIFIGCSNELGGFESGMTAAWFGPVASVVGGGVGSLAVVLGVLMRWPEVARLRSIEASGRAEVESV